MNHKSLKFVPVFILVAVIIIYASKSVSNHVIFFPIWLNVILFLIGIPIAWYYVGKWKIFSSDKAEDKKVILGVNILQTILIAFVIFSFLRLPICLLIQQQSKKNELQTQDCPVTFYSLSIKNKSKRHITFTFQQKDVRLKVKPTIYSQLKASTSPQKIIEIQVRESILGTYVLENYRIKQ
jgi:hypothetical protein